MPLDRYASINRWSITINNSRSVHCATLTYPEHSNSVDKHFLKSIWARFPIKIEHTTKGNTDDDKRITFNKKSSDVRKQETEKKPLTQFLFPFSSVSSIYAASNSPVVSGPICCYSNKLKYSDLSFSWDANRRSFCRILFSALFVFDIVCHFVCWMLNVQFSSLIIPRHLHRTVYTAKPTLFYTCQLFI